MPGRFYEGDKDLKYVRLKKTFALLLILAGIGTMLYPYGLEKYRDYKQKELLNRWQETMEVLEKQDSGDVPAQNDSPLALEALDRAQQPAGGNSGQNSGELPGLQKEEQAGREAERKQREEYIAGHMEGILTIDKIKLRLPILTGATKENLDLSPSSIEHTGTPGETGNYCIAGHRSHTYGRNFNRLNELESGDVIGMQAGGQSYRYVITGKFLVKPEETWVLYKTSGRDKEITLITCEPMINPTHRLIVKGRLMEG